MVLQGTERNLDDHLAAVATLGDEFHLRAHRTGARVVGIAGAERCVAAPNRVGDQRIDVQAGEFVDGVAEQLGGGRVAEHDAPLGVDDQQGVRVGGVKRAEERLLVEFRAADRRLRIGHAHPLVTVATRM